MVRPLSEVPLLATLFSHGTHCTVQDDIHIQGNRTSGMHRHSVPSE